MLAEHRDKLDELAEALVELETIDGETLQRLLGPAEGRVMPSDEPEPTPPSDDAPGAEGGGEEEAEEPTGRPGLAWGQSNVAPPSDGS